VVLIALPTISSPVLGTMAISVVLGGCATARGGFALNHLDVAPSFAGSVMCAPIPSLAEHHPCAVEAAADGAAALTHALKQGSEQRA
jgi:hypothetical protein